MARQLHAAALVIAARNPPLMASDRRHGSCGQDRVPFYLLPYRYNANLIRSSARQSRHIGHHHVSTRGLDANLAQGVVMNRGCFPALHPAGTIISPSVPIHPYESRRQMLLKISPVAFANGLPHKALVRFSSGGVFPGRVLGRAGATQNQNHRGHQIAQRKIAPLFWR